MVADYDFEVKSKKFKMACSIWRPFLTKFDFFLFKLHRNDYRGGFDVADYDFEVKSKKIKMADSI